MSADAGAQPAAPPPAVRTRLVAAADTREHRFWVGLACAVVLHAAVIASAVRSLPRQMGEATGRPDGISVDLVDAADLTSKNTFAEDGGAPGAPKTPPPTKAAPAEPPPPIPEQPPAAKVIPAPPVPETAEPANPREQAKATKEPVDKQAPELAPPTERSETSKLDEPPAQATPPRKQQPAPQPPQQAQPKPLPQQKLSLQLDLSQPQFAPGDRGAAVQRPAGVTRSGENDEFGRGVIRALRKTIPSSNVTGRVTVRFLLSETGNLVEVRLVGGTGDPVLSQNVVFAVKQSSFPIPPGSSTVIDRTFLVTYVYH